MGRSIEQQRDPAWRGHVQAVIVVLLALALRWTVAPGVEAFPYITVYAALGYLLWRVGVAPALLGGVLAAVAVEIVLPLLRTPSASWESGLPVRLGTYLLCWGVLVGAGVVVRRQRQRIETQLELAREEQQAKEAAERRAAELAHLSAQAGARFDAIVRHASDAIVSCSVDGKVLSWNPAAQRLFGHRADEIVGQPIDRLVPTPLAAEHADAMRRVLRGETVVLETTRSTRNGGEVQVRLSLAPMTDQGATYAVTLLAQDIGGRREAEESLRRSEATLRAFHDHSPVLLGVVEPCADGDLLNVYDNRMTREVLGLPAGGTVGRRASELGVPAAIVSAWREACERARALGAPIRFEFRDGDGDGTRWFAATLAPIEPEKGSADRFCYVAEEVTDRHRAEQRLRESEAAARLALDIGRLGTWSWNRELGGFEADARGREICGLAPAGAIALGDVLARVHPDDRARVGIALEAAWHTGAPPYTEELRVQLPDGALRWVAARGQVLPDARGGGLGPVMIGTVRDITTRRLAEQERHDADRRKDSFLATLAHELRNPLAPIATHVELLRRVGDRPETRERALATIERQVQHMVRLVNDLLDLSRVSQDRFELKVEPVSLQAVLDAAIETSRPLLALHGHALVVQPAGSDLWLHGDAVRLTQVFANLLNNAAKYTPRGGRVGIEIAPSDGQVEVTVSDTGIGIPKAMQPRVFDMFAQVDPAGPHSAGGLGIGLAIVRRLVTMHGGSVTVDSAGAGRGSRFSVRLPLPETVGAEAVCASQQGPALRPQRILVADDNVDAAHGLSELLALEGMDVIEVHDGLAALEAEQAQQPDVVLLDIGMPKLTGHEVARAIRAHRGAPRPYLIALTGWGQDEDRRLSVEAGFDAHLVKPVRLDELRAALAQAERALERGRPDRPCAGVTMAATPGHGEPA